MRNLAIFVVIPALAACGTGPVKTIAAVPVKAAKALAKPALVRPALVRPAPPSARVLTAPGLTGVIGVPSDELTRQFGAARLDVWEGDARKLQFAGAACVLDVYLYPPAAGRPPLATYVDARRASDGQDVDRAACISALRKK